MSTSIDARRAVCGLQAHEVAARNDARILQAKARPSSEEDPLIDRVLVGLDFNFSGGSRNGGTNVWVSRVKVSCYAGATGAGYARNFGERLG
jgi:hypothetical protein